MPDFIDTASFQLPQPRRGCAAFALMVLAGCVPLRRARRGTFQAQREAQGQEMSKSREMAKERAGLER